jgi:hypothetical protein
MANESNPGIGVRVGAATRAGAASTGVSAGAAALREARVVTVDVSDRPVIPSILRGGVVLTAPAVNPAKVDELIGRLGPIQRITLPRVLSQSIEAGTRVPRGTPVNIVLVPVNDIPFGIFDNVHAQLAGRSVSAVAAVLANPQVSPILSKDPATVTEAERSTITQALGAIDVGVNDADPTTSFNAAFESLKVAQAFA